MKTRPNDNTYWVHSGQLLAGEYPGNQDESVAKARLTNYLESGVRHFIDLTEAGEHRLTPYEPSLREVAETMGLNVRHQRLSIRDVSVPGHPDVMRRILDQIDECMERETPVYVHCFGGIGRTGTVVGCHLVRQGRTPTDALEFIMDRWRTVEKIHRQPESPETSEQRQYVEMWPKHDAP
jgi:protein tyrosine phosphatase